MHLDMNGLCVSLASPTVVEAWNATQHAFLRHGAETPDRLGQVLLAEPGFALGHATKGLLYALLGRAELMPTVQASLSAAQAAAEAGGANMREREYIRALELYLTGRQRHTAAVLDHIAMNHPGDALAVKLTHAIRGSLGDARGMRASLAGTLPGFDADHPMLGYMMGCQAFALEEMGEYTAAERSGRAGLELCQDDAWGLHAVAHVYDMSGQADDGVRWLAGKSQHWAHCNNFGFHVWWHLALFHLDRGAYGPVLELYDRKIRPEPTDDFRDIANAASLLWRLESEGVSVGNRWEELGHLSANRVEDGSLIFADTHYMMALIRSDRAAEAEALAARIARGAGMMEHDQHEVAALTGSAMANGLLAFRSAEYGVALPALQMALEHLPTMGGSHAQRDVFWRLTIEAALRHGALETAEQLLVRRVLERGAEDGYTARRRQQIAERRAGGVAAE